MAAVKSPRVRMLSVRVPEELYRALVEHVAAHPWVGGYRRKTMQSLVTGLLIAELGRRGVPLGQVHR